MSPLDARVLKLVAEVERDWRQVRAHLAKARSVDPEKGEPEAALVALSLDHAYQAFETLLVRTERALGLPERVGATWHARILFDSGEPVPGLRPAVYPQDAAGDWDALLRFRHFLRHAYPIGLDAAKLRANVARLETAATRTEPFVNALVAALRAE